MNATADLRLSVPARAEHVGVVRQALAGLGEALGMDPSTLADLKTAVTEACMNVVVHAYGEEDGPLEVTAIPEDKSLVVSVRDRGTGIQPRPALEEEPSLHLGLPLIAALSHGFAISGGEGQGTEVRIHMPLAKNGAASEEKAQEVPAPSGTELRIGAGALVRPVLARVISILAAKADFSIDRLSDAVLVGDAVSAHPAADFRDGTLGIAIEEGQGALNVRVGPLAEGAGQRMVDEMEIPGVGGSLQKLVDEIRIERDAGDGSETLLLRIAKTT